MEAAAQSGSHCSLITQSVRATRAYLLTTCLETRISLGRPNAVGLVLVPATRRSGGGGRESIKEYKICPRHSAVWARCSCNGRAALGCAGLSWAAPGGGAGRGVAAEWHIQASNGQHRAPVHYPVPPRWPRPATWPRCPPRAPPSPRASGATAGPEQPVTLPRETRAQCAALTALTDRCGCGQACGQAAAGRDGQARGRRV